MSIFESGENYLETIYKLLLSKNDVHAIDVVNELNFSKPSVSNALKKLVKQEYITIDINNHIHLTQKGKRKAKEINDRHQTLKTLLIKLGVDEKTAEKDACKIEHDLSSESFEAFKKLIPKL